MAEDPNTLKSRSLIRLVEVLSEGEIVGLEDGAKSIYFDDTPYQSADGTYNFKDVQWELRTGVSNQDPLPGFDGVETEIGVSRKVTASTANGGLGPYTFTINDLDVDAIRLKIRLNSLNTSTDGGKIKATSVSFRVEVQPNGLAYQTRVTDTISGKTTSPYERQYRIDLPGSGPWNVRVTRITPDSEEVKLQNDTYVASYTLIKDVKIRYNDTAVLGLVLTAEAFGNSIPRRGFIVKGLKIQVPENYDPETRAYATSGSGTSNGAWNGTFKTAWTNNPAWVFYDLLTNDRYGLGQYIAPAQVDKWALYDIAQYCDELVPDGFGGQEPRFTINAVINSSREAYDVLQTITSVFRGMAYWGAGVVTAVQDKPKDPVQVVNQTNVVEGQFTYTSSGLKDRHSVALITWNDPDDFYRPAVEVIEDPQLILRYGYRPIELVAYGCTSRGQAYRLGKWLLDTESSERETVSYTASFDHLGVRPGDIIEVADPAIAGSRQGGRIQSGSTTTSIKLDVPIRIYSGDTLTTVREDGTLMERSLQPTASPVSTVTATSAFPEAPNANAVYAIGGGLVENRPFRVVSVTENEKHLFDVSAVTYDPNKFARVELGLKFEDPNYSNLTRGTVLPPINLLFQQGDYRANNQIRSYLVASWTQPDDPRISHYEYRVTTPTGGQDSGWTQTTSASVEFDNIDIGTWSIDVRCVTIDNRKSAYVTDDIVVTGRTVPPGTPTNLAAATGLDQISLTWTNPPDIDLDYIEVWGLETTDVNTALIENATQIAEVDSTAFIHTSLTPGDHWYYWVRAVDLVGNIGEYSNRSDAVAGSATSVSSVVGYLTNESHTVATLVDGLGGDYTTAGGTFAVFEGTTEKTGNVAVTYSIVSGSITGGLSISLASTGVYTVTGLTADNGTATLRAEYNGVVLDKVYSITKSKQGSKGGSGDASIVITMNADRQIFKFDGSGALNPPGQYITLSLTKQNTTAVTAWSTSPTVTLYDSPFGAGGIIPQGTVSQDVVYLLAADFGSNTAVTITATVSDGAVFTDKVTIVRVQDGDVGDPGENAVVGYLTNENHTVPASTTGVVSSYAGATGSFKVFWGTNDVSTGQGVVYSTLTNNESLTNNGSGVVIDPSTGVFTVDGGLANGTDIAVVTFRATLPAGLGGGFVDKVFTLSKSKTGSTGADSKLLYIYSDKQTFTYDGTNTLSPAGQYIALTATKQNTTATVTWSTTPSVTLRATSSSSSSIVTTGDSVYLHAADFGASTAVTITATLSDGVVLTDKITIVRVKDGSIGISALTGYLTNESQTIPASAAGIVSSYAGASGIFKVFSGTTDISTGQGITYSTAVNASGLTNSGSGTLINATSGVYAVDGGLSSGTDTATAVLRATLPAGYGGGTIDKVFTITKSKSGSDGSPAKLLSIRTDKQVFTFDGTGGAFPAGQVIRLDADKQNTTASVTWSTSPSVSLHTAATGGSVTTTGNTVYLRIANFGANSAVTITATLTDGTTLTDTVTIVRVQDGAQGEPGDDAVLYYIKALNGTAIKNGTGTLTVEAHKVIGGVDSLLSTGSIQLYVGSTLVTAANGYATGSNGFTGVFDSGDITGDVVVLLKDGAGGTILDSITLVDVLDGLNGSDAVYGYIEPTGPLAWTRAVDQVTWAPTSSTVDLPCTFVQGGVTVARASWRVTRSATGTLTGATVAHPSGDLNSARISVTEINEGTQSFSVRFNYSFGGFTASVAETVLTSLSGSDGQDGNDGVNATLYYIKPTTGTAIKNGSGTLTLEARKLDGSSDTLLSSGTIQLYVGSTLVTAANGFVTGSNGYTGIFDSGDITNDVIVELKNGAAGTVLDSITLVDVTDGTNGVDGSNAVYAYCTFSGPTAWVRAIDQTTWTPSASSVNLDFTFVQGGVEVARYRWVISRTSAGILTGAAGTHPSGNLNTARLTVTEINESTQSMSVRMAYSFGADSASLTETVTTALSGSNGVNAVNGLLTNESVTVAAQSDGTGYSLTNAGGTFKVWSGTTDVTTSAIYNITGGTDAGATWSKTQNGLTLTLNETTGVYTLSGASWSSDSESFTLTATYSGVTITRIYVITKAKAGLTGEDAVVYEVEPSVDSVVKTAAGAYVPTAITFSAYSKTGSQDRVAYAGRFIIATSADGSSFTNVYTSASDQASYAYTVPANVVLVRASLYKNGGTSILVDTQSVAVVSNGANGVDGDDGLNVATVFIYRRTNTATAPAKPSVAATYTFATGAISGLNNSWTSTIPAFTAGNVYLWTCTATASNVSATDSIASSEWAGPQLLATDGTNGTDGYNTATLIAYKRATSVPTDNPGTVTYTFATAAWTPANSWTKTVPSGTNPLYVTSATAYSNTASDTVLSTDWAAPTLLVQNGSDGQDGTSPLTMSLTRDAVSVMAYSNGTLVSTTEASGQLTVWKGATDVTASATLSAVASSGVTGSVNTATNVPVSGAKGSYRITNFTGDTGTLTLSATYQSETVTRIFSVSKSKVGYEIVGALPTTNLFEGRIVYLTTNDKLYRYGDTGWTAAVNGADITDGTLSTAKFANTIEPVTIVTGSTVPPTKSTNTIFLTGTGKVYRWINNAYTVAVDGADIVANSITAGQIAVGAIGADQIAANAITAKKLAVFDSSKVFSTDFDTFNWTTSSATDAADYEWLSYGGSGEVTVGADSVALRGGKCLIVGNNSGNDMRWFVLNKNIVFDPTSMYKLSCRIRRTAGTGNLYLGLAGVAADGTTFVAVNGTNAFSSQHYVLFSATAGYADGETTGSNVSTTYKEFTGYVKGHKASGVNGDASPRLIDTPAQLHVNVRYIRPLILVNHENLPGTYIIDYFDIEKVSSGVLIEPGSITTNKISTFAITADQIAVGAITAAKIAGTELSALKAELGNVVISTAGSLRSGQTAYNTGTGFWLGTDAGTPKFSIGNPSGQYMTWDGTSLNVTKAQISNAYLTTSVLGPSSARIATSSTGHTAPFFVTDTAVYRTGTRATLSSTIGEFLAPDYSTTGSANYDRKRLAFRKIDIMLQLMAAGSGDGAGSTSGTVAVDYMVNGIWQTNVNFLSVTGFDLAGGNASFGAVRYTSLESNNWQRMRIKFTVNTYALSVSLTGFIQNTEESANTAGSFLQSTTGTSPSGASPTPPTWSYDPNWSIDPYLIQF